MRLEILGCSGSVGGPGEACSGYLLQVEGHEPVVVDFGPGVLGRLQERVDPNSVTILLSHLHADHCLDLPSLLVWRRYHPVPAVGRALLYGPSDTPERIGRASAESASFVDDIADTFAFIPWVEGTDVEVGGFTVQPHTMFHPPESYGLRITAPSGKVLAYSGDSGVCDALVEVARDADLFLCEASWTHDPENRPLGVHISGFEAGEAAAKAGAKRLLLTHVPPWTSRDEVVAEARSAFDGPVDAVRQGQVFEL
ncbi:MBL fold metallo-hydrolase [Tsukamurella sp. 8F]|uniref:cyclic nucleotide-degrading phosphodiesterase n=1 Tax=unclassified Tsukamurella TaxID=2633480 RepID=UPI0023B92CE6|nr:MULTISPECIES: cyclic nucleotide-degrading phosphodiesterase [unclassified Tsukamurella]MDF0531008.1 MBL fold metallo-hydrolase [Tsukamurella sp. 8J]MDF0588709.1 MBL fold metallo-hydrolase [Tsukamurella sp. 8F]